MDNPCSVVMQVEYMQIDVDSLLYDDVIVKICSF